MGPSRGSSSSARSARTCTGRGGSARSTCRRGRRPWRTSSAPTTTARTARACGARPAATARRSSSSCRSGPPTSPLLVPPVAAFLVAAPVEDRHGLVGGPDLQLLEERLAVAAGRAPHARAVLAVVVGADDVLHGLLPRRHVDLALPPRPVHVRAERAEELEPRDGPM